MSDVSPQPIRRSRVLPGLLLVALVFAGGAGFWAWASENWFPKAQQAPALALQDGPELVGSTASPTLAQPGVHTSAVDLSTLSERIRALETAPTGNASQSVSLAAERLVLILATRRAMERGAAHVPMAQALARIFPAQQTTLLPAIMQNAASPAGLAALAQEFDALKPKLSNDSGSWMDRLSELAIIRSKGTENPSPAELVAQIETALQRQDVSGATQLLNKHPGRAAASEWIARATAHAAGSRALDSLEALALATPVPAQMPEAANASGQKTGDEN